MTTNEADDHPGVIAPPPLIVAAALVVGLLLDWLVPAYVLAVLFGTATRLFFGGVLAIAGVGLVGLAGYQFHRIGTRARSAKVDTGFALERAREFYSYAFSSREPESTSLENAVGAFPWQPSLVLATHEIYGHLRNPMYVGMIMVAAGIGIALASDWTLVLLAPAAYVLHRGVVLREERYLEAKFGEDYRQYMARVSRYGWPG